MKSALISKNLKNILIDFGIHTIISDDIDYIDVGQDENTITYIPINKISRLKENGLDPWTTNRVNMKIGKFFNKILFIPSSKMEKLVNYYKTSYYTSKGDFSKIFTIVEGEDIRHWYNEKNYVNGGGSLNNSCMRREDSQQKLDIYVENPDVCKLLILKDGDKLLARSLMWTTDNGIYIDRVYTVFNKDENLYKKYISHNNYFNYFNRGVNDVPVVLNITVRRNYTLQPYFDTFSLNDRTLTAYI